MNIDAFILIGGRSSRFGTDKAFVEVEHEPLAARVARIVDESLSPANVRLVAASDDQFTSGMLQTLARSVIFDLKPGNGAWSGLHAALSEAKCEWIFVTACDYPMITHDLLRRLASFIADRNDAVMPRQPDGRLQPLCAFYRVSSTLAAVETMLTTESQLPPVTSIVDGLKTHIVEPDEYRGLENSGQFFLNINTAADLVSFGSKFPAEATENVEKTI